MKELTIAPSVLSADFLNLKKELTILKEAGICWIHYDVMDYHFVPNLTFGPGILSQIKAKFDFKIDAHLMITTIRKMDDYLAPFLSAGVDQVTLHVEALDRSQIEEFLKWCQKNNVMPSLALNPKTDLIELKTYLPLLKNVLVMSVEPGFGGQKFDPVAIKKLCDLDQWRKSNNANLRLEIDGGINAETIHLLDETGIDMVVAGSYLFGHSDIKERIEKIRYVK